MGGRFLSIGECMVELSQAGDGLLRKGFAGDTFNTAWYARACLPDDWSVDYFTGLGDDSLSEDMLAFIEAENADLIYFSGITLAVLSSPNAVETFLSELRRAKAAGKRVVFDPNIRPRLWADKATMLDTVSQGARAATLVMPSFDDEATHFGDTSVEATIDRYRALGVVDIVVKDGAKGATLDFGGQRSHAPAVQAVDVVDTTSAGDSFNGAFLARYVTGSAPDEAASFAAEAAAVVIGHHGALISPELLPLVG